jgi:hypothetical protein
MIEQLKEKKKDRHKAKMAYQEAPRSSASFAGWCDITNWFIPGTIYTGTYTGYFHTFTVNFTTNPDETVQITYASLDGVDHTQDALNNGGSSVPATPSTQYGYDCNQYDYYLAWALSGPFVDWFEGLTGNIISSPLLYANYNNDGAAYFYFWAVGWHSCNIYQQSALLNNMPKRGLTAPALK